MLPWRAAPGARPDPYRVWLSEVMLQQTTVATVAPRFVVWVERWPTVEALAAADAAEVMAAWAGLGYYARARNLVATARLVAARGGFPASEAGLRALPGIGDYTAAAIAAIAFGAGATVIDANVERVVSRLFRLASPGGVREAAAMLTPPRRAGDFAQAMMDLGATICTPRTPRCLSCPLLADCGAAASGDQGTYPVKPVKAPKPVRHGTIFWAVADAHILLVRRPPRGLLGGMRALPTGPWADSPPGLAASPIAAAWRMVDARVEHVFTHFRLQLALAATHIDRQSDVPDGEWWPADSLDEAGLPTVFAKAARAMGEDR
ncbi:A/G-specific adenine glycosylase [uncultured Sphingomonas sp.]|uniref:A/G-specific adenine glycosylase n=1 Tax=uncultured Sphingomonas sp. TaxID=158754 RepID=UPI0035CABE50